MADIDVSIVEEVIEADIVEEVLDVSITEENIPVDEAVDGLSITLVDDEISVEEGTGSLDVNLAEETLDCELAEVLILPREDEVPYSERVDFTVDDTIIYRGYAVPGSVTSAAVWRIKRMTIAPDNDVTTEWAGGNSLFDNIWDDHLSLSYS